MQQPKTKQPSANAFLKWTLKWMVHGGEASQYRPEKSSQMALVRGYCLLEGPPRLVAPFGQLWKRCSLPLASLTTDFLEAVLREMACSVPDFLLCQFSSPHTSHLPPQNTQILLASAVDADMTGFRGHQQFPNSTLVHPPSSFLQSTEIKFKCNPGKAVAGHVWILTRGKPDKF